jgi:hypothetical protein
MTSIKMWIAIDVLLVAVNAGFVGWGLALGHMATVMISGAALLIVTGATLVQSWRLRDDG